MKTFTAKNRAYMDLESYLLEHLNNDDPSSLLDFLWEENKNKYEMHYESFQDLIRDCIEFWMYRNDTSSEIKDYVEFATQDPYG